MVPRMDLAQIRNLEVIAEDELFFRRFNGGRILLLSPNIHDFFFWKKSLPNSNFTISTKSDWDLEYNFCDSKFANSCCPEFDQKQLKLFDLAIAQNVFMYVQDPTKAVRNIGSISNNLFIQDITYRKRSATATGLGSDGDISRYSITQDQVNHPTVHVISEVFNSSRILMLKEYEGATNQYHAKGDSPRHVMVFLEIAKRKSYAPISQMYSRKSILKLLLNNYTSARLSKFNIFR